LFVATVAAIRGSAVPDGLIPYAAVVLLQVFSGYCLTLTVAIVSESMSWTVAALVTGNLLVNFVMYAVAKVPGMQEALRAETIAWRQPIPALVAVEVAAVAVMIGLTFLVQARKTHFV
jgi:hypothetical protein